MSTFNLEILRPEQRVFTGEVESLKVFSCDGWIEVLAAHAPLFSLLSPGSLSYTIQGKGEVSLKGTEGFLSVKDNLAQVYLV